MGNGGEVWCGDVYRMAVVVGLCVHATRGAERVRAKKSETEPCEMAMGDGEEMWCGGAYKVMVMVGLCVRAMRGAERVRAKKPETEPLRLDFGRAA